MSTAMTRLFLLLCSHLLAGRPGGVRDLLNTAADAVDAEWVDGRTPLSRH